MNHSDANLFIGLPVGLISGIYFATKLGIKAFALGPLLGIAAAQIVTHLSPAPPLPTRVVTNVPAMPSQGPIF